MPPEAAEIITGVPAAQIVEATRTLWSSRPVAFYTWSGLEQHSNVTQTVRAIGVLYALTGCLDAPGGNVLFLTVDLCTLCLRINDPSITMFVASALFGDGAAAIVLRNTAANGGRANGAGAEPADLTSREPRRGRRRFDRIRRGWPLCARVI